MPLFRFRSPIDVSSRSPFQDGDNTLALPPGDSKWLDPMEARPTLARAVQLWGPQSLYDLGTVQYEWWQRERGFVGSTQIGCVFDTSLQPIGFLTGYPWHGHRCFYISAMVSQSAHPYPSDVRRKLLELAMDESQRLGYHGWVACAPDSCNLSMWRELGFSPYDDFTYRRMGYLH